MNAKDLPTLNACVNKLMDQLAKAQDELDRRERSCGTYHDPRKMTLLRDKIASLTKRLERAEWLQEAALRRP